MAKQSVRQTIKKELPFILIFAVVASWVPQSIAMLLMPFDATCWAACLLAHVFGVLRYSIFILAPVLYMLFLRGK